LLLFDLFREGKNEKHVRLEVLAVKKRSTGHSSKKVVQRLKWYFELGVLPQSLPQTAQDILGVLGAEGVAAEAVRIAGVVKSDVTYWKNRFVRAGALVPRESQTPQTLGKPRRDQRFSAGSPKYYDLTPNGSKLLTGSDNTLSTCGFWGQSRQVQSCSGSAKNPMVALLLIGSG
jgi:hypothetical protein